MECEFGLLNSGGTLRVSSLTGKVRTTLMLLVVMVVRVPLIQGQNQSLEYEHLPHLDERLSENANTSHDFPSVKENYVAIYFKCRCEGNQAWNGSVCVNIETKVIVTNPDTGITDVSLTDDFEGVTVKNVQCSWDHVQVDLDPNESQTSQFTLLPHGTLSWQQQEYEHYCIEHTLDADGISLSWEAHVCLPPPTVPCCCLDKSTLCQNGSLSCTVNDSAHRFSPSVMIDQKFTEWPQVMTVAGRKCKDDEKTLSFPLNAGESHLSYESGAVSIVWKTPYYFEKTQKEGFCVSLQEGGGYTATICHEDQYAIYRNLCGNATCVRKCCPEGKIHAAESCIDAEDTTQLWEPYFFEADLKPIVTPFENLTVLYGLPHCFTYLADPSDNEDDKFYLLGNGDLFTPAINERDAPTHYCVDNFITDDKIVTKALLCFSEEYVEPACTTAKETVYPVLLVISAAFLGITLVIYLSVPDLRNKLHGRCLISLTSAFFVAYVLMSISYLSSSTLSPSVCTSLAFFKHLSLLAAFFWLNVMCFDIWRTLRKTRTVPGGRRSLHRFLWYSLYAWGSSLIIAVVAVALEQTPASSSIIRPNFDSMFCWFSDAISLWIYLYSWVSLVLLTNLVFFGLVIVILVKGQRNSLLRRSREMNRERMWLYVKLFLVMGVTWIAEVVSYQHGRCVEWMFMDIINALEGVTLFLVFILSRTTINKIKTRWRRGASKTIGSPSTTLSSSLSSYNNRKQDSVVSRFKNSLISKKFSNASSTSESTEMESFSPMNTLNEVADESSHLEPREEDESSLALTMEAGREQPT